MPKEIETASSLETTAVKVLPQRTISTDMDQTLSEHSSYCKDVAWFQRCDSLQKGNAPEILCMKRSVEGYVKSLFDCAAWDYETILPEGLLEDFDDDFQSFMPLDIPGEVLWEEEIDITKLKAEPFKPFLEFGYEASQFLDEEDE